jgi:hypothetical protein
MSIKKTNTDIFEKRREEEDDETYKIENVNRV